MTKIGRYSQRGRRKEVRPSSFKEIEKSRIHKSSFTLHTNAMYYTIRLGRKVEKLSCCRWEPTRLTRDREVGVGTPN